MGGKIYPIGIQNFEKLRRGGYFILINGIDLSIGENRELLYLKSAAPFWQKSAYFYA